MTSRTRAMLRVPVVDQPVGWGLADNRAPHVTGSDGAPRQSWNRAAVNGDSASDPNYKQAVAGRGSGTSRRLGAGTDTGPDSSLTRVSDSSESADRSPSAVWPDGSFLVPPRRRAARGDRVARSHARPAAREPGDDLSSRRLPAGTGGLRRAGAAPDARAPDARVDHRDRAADRPVHGRH